jgi:WD40 repeat protein
MAKLLSVAAWRIDPSQEARYAMLTAGALPGMRVLGGDTGPVYSVAFNPNGKIMASANADRTIRLWDVATGREIGKPLTGHRNEVNSVAFSPDGTMLASGGFDGTIRLWDVAYGQEIGAPFTGETGPVESVAFSPDGQTMASGSTDGTIRLWDVAFAKDIAPYLCASAGQTLTPADWKRYMPPGAAYRNVCP